VVCTKRVYNDRLLMFLLRHLKPERYAGAAPADPAAPALPTGLAVEASLREMEPRLPAPAERLLDPETLEHELHLADVADGALPHFFSEQRPPKSKARLEAEARAAEQARGEAAWEKSGRGEKLTDPEFADLCRYLDPTQATERSKKRYR
jgi:hypothetical protein